MIKQINPKLSDVCLCAIVRDEEMNPAGGIVDFLDCTLPFVENAVIVDTGSKDKTRELLEKAKSKYLGLTIFDHRFRGYAQARNFSLDMAKKLGKYALVLDADERLFAKDFKKLQRHLLYNDLFGINFQIKDIYPERAGSVSNYGLHNPRCFSLEEDIHYENFGFSLCEEHLYYKQQLAKMIEGVIPSEIVIKHFRPSKTAMEEKSKWYDSLSNPKTHTQISSPHFEEWKQLNPRRKDYN